MNNVLLDGYEKDDVIFCAFCDSPATKIVKETRCPLCNACSDIYQCGQAGHKRTVGSLDEYYDVNEYEFKLKVVGLGEREVDLQGMRDRIAQALLNHVDTLGLASDEVDAVTYSVIVDDHEYRVSGVGELHSNSKGGY